MAQHKISADAAFERLVQASQRQNKKLRLIAQEVCDTGTLTTDG